MFRAILIVFFSAFGFAQSTWPTLAKVLADNKIPSNGVSATALSQAITSFAVLSDSDRFVIGYYVHTGEFLDPPLWLRVFDKRSSHWRSVPIRKAEGRIVGNLSAECLGSVLSVRSVSSLLFIETHLNPSAGCVLVISPDLKLRTVLSGGVISDLGPDAVLVEHSQIHFAPTHPLELDIYDLSTNRLAKLYPPAHDPIREDYMRDLRDNLSEEWCRQENATCDPEVFETALDGEPVFDAQSSALAFKATFNSFGYGQKAEDVVGDRQVVYIFRRIKNGWEYREFEASRLATPLSEAVKAPAVDTFFH